MKDTDIYSRIGNLLNNSEKEAFLYLFSSNSQKVIKVSMKQICQETNLYRSAVSTMLRILEVPNYITCTKYKPILTITVNNTRAITKIRGHIVNR